jgi:hypothetical protein
MPKKNAISGRKITGFGGTRIAPKAKPAVSASGARRFDPLGHRDSCFPALGCFHHLRETPIGCIYLQQSKAFRAPICALWHEGLVLLPGWY